MLRGSIKGRGKCLEREHTRVFNVLDSLSLIDAVGITSEFDVESTCGRDKKTNMLRGSIKGRGKMLREREHFQCIQIRSVL